MIDLANLPSSPFKSINYFNEQLMIDWGISSREHLSLSLFIIEIDNFQSLVKTHEESEINNIILSVANVLNSILQRQSDFMSQADSHRFIFLANEMDFKQAVQFAEKFHQVIAGLEIRHQNSPATERVTISIGHATCTPESNDCEGPHAFDIATQKHLEKAINAGGNCSKASLRFNP